MAPLAWTLRVYWKRYTFAAVASILVSKYAAKRFRDNNIIRAYCRQAKRYGEERVAVAERDGKPGQAKKMVILLNPAANKRDAKLQFMKYSAPLFHLSGIDVTVVESQREGHLRSLMSYIDPQTDYIVVAGGDGTLMEVLTGLMRRTDVEEMKSIPIGIVPLGRENRFYQSNLSSTAFKSPVRAIGDATMDIIRSEHTKPLNLMEIKPESGRLLYALSSVQWGPMRDAHENRDGFRLVGKLRLLFSHLNVALKRWPRDYLLHVWYPQYCQLKHDQDTPSPPSEKTTTTTSHTTTTNPDPNSSTAATTSFVQATDTSSPFTATSFVQSTTTVDSSSSFTASSSVQRKASIDGRWLSPVKAHCLRPRYGGRDGEEETSKSPVSGGSELTGLAGSDLEYKELKVMGFCLGIGARGEGGEGSVALELNTWLDGSIQKSDFIKRGWMETLGRYPHPLPCLSLSCPRLVLQPISHSETWLSIDGEVYEAMPISVTAIPSAVRVITSETH